MPSNIKKFILILLFCLLPINAFADIAWYIAPYKREDSEGFDKTKPLSMHNHPGRYCAIEDYGKQIYANGGNWAVTEVLGDRAIVKVKAEPSTLATLNIVFKRMPKDRLDDPLLDLSLAVKIAIINKILDMGYTIQEINDRLPNDLGTYTLRDVLKMMATRRRKPRYDAIADKIICDGAIQPVRPIEDVDNAVK